MASDLEILEEQIVRNDSGVSYWYFKTVPSDHFNPSKKCMSMMDSRLTTYKCSPVHRSSGGYDTLTYDCAIFPPFSQLGRSDLKQSWSVYWECLRSRLTLNPLKPKSLRFLGEQSHTLIPCWMPKPCLQETSVHVVSSQLSLEYNSAPSVCFLCVYDIKLHQKH